MIPALQLLLNFIAAGTGGEAKALWPKGPGSECKTKDVALAQYILWLKDLEAGSLKTAAPKELVQRLRRLAYSKHTKDVMTGAEKFDTTISGVTPQDEPPLTTDHLKQESLDGLFSTRAIITARNQTVDVSHIWVAADLLMAGPRLSVRAAADSDLGALVSWTGDLGGALTNWARATGAFRTFGDEAPTLVKPRGEMLLDEIKTGAAKTDLLGDMDGIVLGTRWDDLGAFTISSELNDYFKDDALPAAQAKQLNRPVSARRFHYFMKSVEPKVEATGLATSPLEVSITDTVEATADVKEILTDAVDDIIAGVGGFGLSGVANASISAEDVLRLSGSAEFDKLCGKFVEFLKTGLATGDATWPPASL